MKRQRLLNAIDWVLVALAFVVSYEIFYHADAGFSYDFHYYIDYFYELRAMSWGEVLSSGAENFPYVAIYPFGLFEIGFASLTRLLLGALNDVSATFALIGATSIATRLAILRALRVSWIFVFIINLYAITLFEANAIRLGCACTLLLCGIYALHNDRKVGAVALFGLSMLFHVQIIFYLAFFIFAFSFHSWLMVSFTRFALAIVAFCIVAVGVVRTVVNYGFLKFTDYSGKSGGSGGLTAVSLLAAALMVMVLIRLAQRSRVSLSASEAHGRIWSATTFATIPSLVMLMSSAGIGAFGDRVWQLAFVVLAVVAFIGSARLPPRLSRIQAIVGLLTLLSAANVLYRYPLSNFFNPLTPEIFVRSAG